MRTISDLAEQMSLVGKLTWKKFNKQKPAMGGALSSGRPQEEAERPDEENNSEEVHSDSENSIRAEYNDDMDKFFDNVESLSISYAIWRWYIVV